MEPFGVSKETLALIKREPREMADRFQRNFVRLRRTKLASRFQLLALVALNLKQQEKPQLRQQLLSAQPAVSNWTKLNA
jgi:hypothetical protein